MSVESEKNGNSQSKEFEVDEEGFRIPNERPITNDACSDSSFDSDDNSKQKKFEFVIKSPQAMDSNHYPIELKIVKKYILFHFLNNQITK